MDFFCFINGHEAAYGTYRSRVLGDHRDRRRCANLWGRVRCGVPRAVSQQFVKASLKIPVAFARTHICRSTKETKPPAVVFREAQGPVARTLRQAPGRHHDGQALSPPHLLRDTSLRPEGKNHDRGFGTFRLTALSEWFHQVGLLPFCPSVNRPLSNRSPTDRLGLRIPVFCGLCRDCPRGPRIKIRAIKPLVFVRNSALSAMRCAGAPIDFPIEYY